MAAIKPLFFFMANAVTEQIDELLALVRNRLAAELGIPVNDIAIDSLNFDSNQEIAVIYELVSQNDAGFGAKERPQYSNSVVQLGLFSIVPHEIDADAAEAARRAAIDLVADLSTAVSQEIDNYRTDLFVKPALKRIAELGPYNSAIDKVYGWDNISGSEARWRLCLLTFQLVSCVH